MMNILLTQGFVDYKRWVDAHPDLDHTKVKIFRVAEQDELRKYVQSDSTTLIGRYDVAPIAWRAGSDALHECLSVLHDARYVESNSDGWEKVCPAS